MLFTALLIIRPINNIAQTFAHPQSIARQVVTEVEVSLGYLMPKCWSGADVSSIHERAGLSSLLLLYRMMGLSQRYVIEIWRTGNS
jgi:hypothetical protein